MAEYCAFVGLDIHKDTVSAVAASPDREGPDFRGVIRNSRAPKRRLLGGPSPHGAGQRKSFPDSSPTFLSGFGYERNANCVVPQTETFWTINTLTTHYADVRCPAHDYDRSRNPFPGAHLAADESLDVCPAGKLERQTIDLRFLLA